MGSDIGNMAWRITAGKRKQLKVLSYLREWKN